MAAPDALDWMEQPKYRSGQTIGEGLARNAVYYNMTGDVIGQSALPSITSSTYTLSSALNQKL